MIVLGLAESKDRKGSELEELTRRLLGAMGYENIVRNKIDSGGSEIDVSADFVMPTPGANRRQRLICECKAYRNPVVTDDWLKFLGKVFQEESLRQQEVIGCFIALSGANGPVAGSYDRLPQRDREIHLVSGDTLSALVRKVFGVQESRAVQSSISKHTTRTYRAIDLAYFAGEVYWVVFFEGEYTLLRGDGNPVSAEAAAGLSRHVEVETDAGSYVDLMLEEKARQRAMAAQKAVLCAAMAGNGRTALPLPKDWQHDASEQEITDAISFLCDKGWLDASNETLSINSLVESDVRKRIAFYFFLLKGPLTIGALGLPWYTDHIDAKLVTGICEVQGRLELASDEVATAVKLLRWSPGALAYALVPDPMIVTHRIDLSSIKLTERIIAADRKTFFRKLQRHLVADFKLGTIGRNFYDVHGIVEIDESQRFVIKGKKGLLHEGEARERLILGEMGEAEGGHLVLVQAIEDVPDPWERGLKMDADEVL